MRLLTAGFAVLGLALGGCASTSGNVYSRDQARQVQTVQTGVIETVRAVQIEGSESGVGAVSGAVLGGVAGSTVGQGKGSVLATVAGAVIGGIAGAAAEKTATKENAQEIMVRLDDGKVVSIVQAADTEFRPGERVRILNNGYESRVTY